MDSLRSERMVSIKKTYNSAKVKQKRHLPLYNSPYQLSSSYFFKFYGRFSQEVFEEGWDLTKKLIFSAASYKDANGKLIKTIIFSLDDLSIIDALIRVELILFVQMVWS